MEETLKPDLQTCSCTNPIMVNYCSQKFLDILLNMRVSPESLLLFVSESGSARMGLQMDDGVDSDSCVCHLIFSWGAFLVVWRVRRQAEAIWRVPIHEGLEKRLQNSGSREEMLGQTGSWLYHNTIRSPVAVFMKEILKHEEKASVQLRNCTFTRCTFKDRETDGKATFGYV